MLHTHGKFSRVLFVLSLLMVSDMVCAVEVSNGGVNYSLTAQALADMTDEVILALGYVITLLYAVASLLACYNAAVIYVKFNTGEDGIMKSIAMLVGAILFLMSATIILPSFFGYSAASSGFSPFG